MADIVSQPWFWPAVIVSVGLPLVLLVLGESSTTRWCGAAARGARSCC